VEPHFFKLFPAVSAGKSLKAEDKWSILKEMTFFYKRHS
jgi:hypothetical protein